MKTIKTSINENFKTQKWVKEKWRFEMEELRIKSKRQSFQKWANKRTQEQVKLICLKRITRQNGGKFLNSNGLWKH